MTAFPALGAYLDYDEVASGDLSSNPSLPSLLATSLGSNFITASVDRRDKDYFTLTIPAGCFLESIFLRQSDGSEATFLSLQAGSTFTEPAESADFRNLLGYASFFGSDVGRDLLPSLGSAAEAIGFKGPLGEQLYTFWVDQSSPAPTAYKLEFVIAEDVPGPGSLVTAIAATCLMIPWSRRAKR